MKILALHISISSLSLSSKKEKKTGPNIPTSLRDDRIRLACFFFLYFFFCLPPVNKRRSSTKTCERLPMVFLGGNMMPFISSWNSVMMASCMERRLE
jgi:hypothetical protein